MLQTAQQVSELGITLWRSKWIILLGIFALNIIAGAFALVYLSRESGARRVEKLEFASGNKLLGFLIILLGFFFVWAVRLIFLAISSHKSHPFSGSFFGRVFFKRWA